jgi:hypothetical protein
VISTAYRYTATVTAIQPATYTWQASEHSPIIHASNDLKDAVDLSWTQTGLKSVTVTVAHAGGAISDSFSVEIVEPDPRVPWTIMVYLNGDNDLDIFSDDVFNKLESVAGDPDVNIVVLWDRTDGGTWDSGTKRYIVKHDDNPFELAEYTEGVDVWDYGELNFGDPQTLYWFVSWAKTQLPAEHYLLAITDHGGGWSPNLPVWLPYMSGWALGGTGMSWDETGIDQTPDYLSTYEVGQALRYATDLGADPIDVVFYDACLMSMLEEIHEIKDYANYFVASANVAWATFPYDGYIGGIEAETEPVSVAENIVNTYQASLLSFFAGTMTAFDLNSMDAVTSAADDLAQIIINESSDTLLQNQILSAYEATQKLDYDTDRDIDEREGYVDLYDFANKLYMYVDNKNVDDAAMNIVSLFNSGNFIVGHAHQNGWPYYNLERIRGVSIYVPFGEEIYFGNAGICQSLNPDPCQPIPANYESLCARQRDFYVTTTPLQATQLLFAQDTNWDEFVNNFIDEQFCQEAPSSITDEIGEENASVYSSQRFSSFVDARSGLFDPSSPYKVYLPAVFRNHTNTSPDVWANRVFDGEIR